MPITLYTKLKSHVAAFSMYIQYTIRVTKIHICVLGVNKFASEECSVAGDGRRTPRGSQRPDTAPCVCVPRCDVLVVRDVRFEQTQLTFALKNANLNEKLATMKSRTIIIQIFKR